MTPDLMEPVVTAGGRLRVVSDELLFSLTSTMDDHVFEDVLAVCDGDISGLADTSGMQPYCGAILSLGTTDLEELYMARDQRPTPYNNAFGVGGGRGGRSGGRARGRGGFGGGRGAFGRGSGGPPPKGRNAPYGSYLTSYRKDDIRNSGFNSLLDSLASTTIELAHLTTKRQPSTRSTMICVPIVSAARSKEPVTVLKTLRHANSDRRQCLRRLRGRQGSKFSRMFDLGKRSLSVASIILSKHLNSALASSKSSISSTLAAMTHPPNQVRVWY